jgi:hypothetical protein
MSSYSDALPAADDMASVNAYQTKDYCQATSQTFDVLANQVETNRDGRTTTGFSTYEQRSIENAATNLAVNLSGRYIADLTALIDSAGNFSDAALLRSTYGLASQENALGGSLTQAAAEDLVEGATSPTYGAANPETDLFWLMAPNQKTNLARVSTGVAYREVQVALDNAGPFDGTVIHRMASFWGIPIVVDPAVGTTDIFLLRRGTIEIHDHMPLMMKDVNVAAFQQLKGLIKGSNLIVKNPTWNSKLSGVTA